MDQKQAMQGHAQPYHQPGPEGQAQFQQGVPPQQYGAAGGQGPKNAELEAMINKVVKKLMPHVVKKLKRKFHLK